MKLRMVTVYRLTYTGQSFGSQTWFGTCPQWAAQPVPVGATLTRQRVGFVGRNTACPFAGCIGGHPNIRA